MPSETASIKDKAFRAALKEGARQGSKSCAKMQADLYGKRQSSSGQIKDRAFKAALDEGVRQGSSNLTKMRQDLYGK